MGFSVYGGVILSQPKQINGEQINGEQINGDIVRGSGIGLALYVVHERD
jgi:hypothetical protein